MRASRVVRAIVVTRVPMRKPGSYGATVSLGYTTSCNMSYRDLRHARILSRTFYIARMRLEAYGATMWLGNATSCNTSSRDSLHTHHESPVL